jgi:hypothetical protein
MNEEITNILNIYFINLTNKISNYLFKNNIMTDTHIFFERNNDSKSTLGIKVSKGTDNDLDNYVIFNFTKINDDIDLNVKASDKNKRPALFLLRYFSDEILKFIISIEYEIYTLDITENIKLETNHILHTKSNEKTFDI